MESKDWLARDFLCRCLGMGASEDSALKSSLAFVAKHPFRLRHLLSSLVEFWDFKAYLAYLRRQGEKVADAKNRELVDQIVWQAGRNLCEESADDWPEIVGLFAQKLAHLRYYEEFLDEHSPF